jgi:integrase
MTEETPPATRRKKKAQNGAGTVERRGALWWLQVLRPLEPGETKRRRGRIPIEGSEKMTETQARRASVVVARDFRAGKIEFQGRTHQHGAFPSPSTIRTVRELGEAWTSGELLKTHGAVNRLRVKATAATDTWTMRKHVYGVHTRGAAGPVFGDLPVAQVTSDDVAAVMASHSSELAAQTRMHTYQRLRRLFDLAIFPCRLRKEGDNPVTRYVRPERDAEKLFCFLYPTEVLALLRGTNAKGETVIPLGRRVLYAIGVYTGQRKGSLYALQWKHFDAKHGSLASFKTKTKTAQYFVADPGLAAVLKAWRVYCRNPGGDTPIVTDEAVGYDPKRVATALRDDLKAVGVTRAILFEEEAPNVEPLRFHDLRSTFCTWGRRAGKSDAWIGERTGHEPSGDMISRYDRGASMLSDLGYGPFPDISRALPELAALADGLRIVRGLLAALRPQLPHKLPQGGPQGSTVGSGPKTEKRAASDSYDLSGREDLNLRLLGPEPSALPGCATPRYRRRALPRASERAPYGGPLALRQRDFASGRWLYPCLP